MLKIKTDKKKPLLIITVVFLFATATTIGGFIAFYHPEDTSGIDGTNSDAYSSLGKKYSSKSSSSEIEDKNQKDESQEEDNEESSNSKDQKTENSSSVNSDSNSHTDNNAPQKDHGSPQKTDTITTRDVYTTEEISFETETRNEPNLPKGEVQTIRNGTAGLKKITSRETYKNGILISSEIINTEIVTEPISKINLLGTSDFNLNNSYIQLYPNAKVSRNGSEAPAFMILVNGAYYIDFWYDPITWKSYAPSTALIVSGGVFTYDGNTYSYSPGPLDNNFALSEAFCAEYGLACGRW